MSTSVAFFAWQISGAVRVTLKPTLKLRGRSWAFDDDDPHLHPKMSILKKVPVYSTGLCMYVRAYACMQDVFTGWNGGLLRTTGSRCRKNQECRVHRQRICRALSIDVCVCVCVCVCQHCYPFCYVFGLSWPHALGVEAMNRAAKKVRYCTVPCASSL